MKTILQKIGPLYGEVVNGTVFGQPNGSIYYRPGGNRIFTIEDNTATNGYIKAGTGGISHSYWVVKADGTGASTTKAAILGTNVVFTGPYAFRLEVADSAAFTNILYSGMIARTPPFEGDLNDVGINSAGKVADYTVVAGTKYYIRYVLVWEGSDICTSDVFEVEGLV